MPGSSSGLEERATRGSASNTSSSSAARSADRGCCETSSRAPPDPRRRRASTPVATWLADAGAVTTTPGRTGSPDRRPLASHAALAPASAGSAAKSSSRSMTRDVIAPLGVRRPPYPLLRSGSLPPYGGTERNARRTLPNTSLPPAGGVPDATGVGGGGNGSLPRVLGPGDWLPSAVRRLPSPISPQR